MFSAQTTDKQVNIATKSLFEEVNDPKDLITYWVSKLEKKISSLNFYKNKSKSAIKTAEMLLDKYDSRIPNDIEELIKLPWVWVKTAKVVLWVLYDAPYIWVDTHVHRICNRIWICKTKTPEETDKYLEKNITLETKKKVHHALVLFWRYICTARNPKCESCFLNKSCEFIKK